MLVATIASNSSKFKPIVKPMMMMMLMNLETMG